MYERFPTILEQIGIVHGPRDLLARYFSFADEKARDLGLRLRISQDFERLIALNEQHSDNWPRLSPIFNPKYNDLRNGTAFLIEGIDEFGDTALTSAGRLYDHGERSLADALRSLHVFYDDPAPHVAAAESVKVTAPSAEHLCGHIMFSGAMWVRPEYRRHGFTKIIPRLTRGCALTRWNTPVFWAYIDHDLDKIGVTRAYGSWHVEDGILTSMPSWRGDHRVLFLSMGQATLIRDIARSVSRAESPTYETATGTSRWRDRHITNSSLAERHGMSTRS
jgi:GNAT superfamily N-acetyltransferase